MKDIEYEIYKKIKKFIEHVERSNDDLEEHLIEWRESIKNMDAAHNGYAGRYEREKAVIASFTPEQINHICCQIGDWYLMMKPLLEGQHNLGHMKEKLKIMICGE